MARPARYSEEIGRVRQALKRLPDDYRRVIVMRRYEGYSFEEIAVMLGRREEAARKLWGRALMRLGQILGTPSGPEAA